MSADGESPQDAPSPYLTVREAYLHLNEKTLYAMLQDSGIPATKVTGKWLSPRKLLDDWLLESTHGGVLADRLLIAGSDDPWLAHSIARLAQRADDGTLIDPCNGRADIAARVLRHVSEAFVEDPVRILRLARFAARFHDFTVAPDTLALMRDMVDNGEADALVAERVWQELSRGLMEAKPSRMIEVLRACGALKVVLPEADALFGVP